MMAATPATTGALGVIPDCATAGCGRTCCEFAEGNYIALYPGEVEAASKSGQSLSHLELAPLPMGGHRAVCRATDKANCDRGYKPLDCASYPLFPTLDSSGALDATLKGAKCPLLAAALEPHRAWVVRYWNEVCQRFPAAQRWLAEVSLVGYQRLPVLTSQGESTASRAPVEAVLAASPRPASPA
ncbi:MAG: hypothetical protein KDA37_12355 [Planctomycetales bacterium]|nr:hypothetical protein [Planctomycetales bacterium]